MKKYLCIVLMLWQGLAFCQRPQLESSDYLIGELYDLYGIKVSFPDGYKTMTDHVGWRHNKDYDHTIGGIYYLLASSRDDQCLIMYPRIFDKLIQRGVNSTVDGYLGYIYREILQSADIMDEDTKFRSNYASNYDPGHNLTSITGKDIREAFNTDKLCYYSIPCNEGMFYNVRGNRLTFVPERYSYVTRVFFLKEGGYHFDLLLLMTDEAHRNKGKYLGELSGTIRFDDEKCATSWDFTEYDSE